MVRADKTKGMVIVKRTSDDQLIHFMWKDRKTGNMGLDLIVFPDDATWRRLNECTTGRVYLLEFKTGTRHFFWMQEPNAAKDDELSETLTDAINGRVSSGGSSNLQSLLGQLGGGAGAAYNQLASTSGRSSATATAGSTTSSATSQPTSTSTNAASKPSSSTSTSSATGSSSALSDRLADVMNRITTAPQPTLTDVLNTQEVLATGALQNPDVLAELQKYLPESESNSVIQTLRSPQFRQMVDHLNHVLSQSPQALSTLLSNFGLHTPAEPAATRLETFLKAIIEAAKKDESKDKMDQS